MNIESVNLNIKIPEGTTIKNITETPEFDDWIYPLKVSFALTELGSTGYKNIYRELSSISDSMHHYVAYQNSLPVASCSIFLDSESDSAGVYNCGTVPEARKKGISTALV